MNRPVSATSVLAGTLKLSSGTILVRLASGASQFLLVVWLSPTQFGHWAAAVSATAVFTSLTNFGLVDGYLARSGFTYAQLRRQSLLANTGLALLTILVAALYWLSGRSEVGILAVLLAANIPLQGYSEVLYARRLQQHSYRRIVTGQSIAAGAKVVAGIAIAALTGSPTALGVANIAFSLALIAWLIRSGGTESLESGRVERQASRRDKVSWTANALASKLPAQIGFLVAQFFTTADVLGIYYISYQAIVVVSALVAPPLRRVALSSLSSATPADRDALFRVLSHTVTGATTALCAGAGLALLVVEPYAPTQWAASMPAIAVFLSLLPSRLSSPLIDALQQASNSWWRSTRFHAFESLAIALAALSATSDSVMTIAACITLVRLVAILIRIATLQAFNVTERALFASLLAVTASMLALSALHGGAMSLPLLVSVGLLGTVWCIISLRRTKGRFQS